MPDLTPSLAPEILAACRSGAADAAGSLASALGGEFVLRVGEPATYEESAADGLAGPGLAILLTFGDVGAAIVLPESSGMLPSWYADPDATGKSKLNTLAQELSMLLVPESLAATGFEAARVAALDEALRRAGASADAQRLPLALEQGEKRSTLSLVWPLAQPKNLFTAPAADSAPAEGAATPADPESAVVATPESAPEALPAEGAAGPPGTSVERQPESSGELAKTAPALLPAFKRSLLKISVPVTVTLATQRKPIQEIVELGPGSIVRFEKTCEEPLELAVGGRMIACGDVVKVGDKFGLKITEMVSVGEQFVAVP